jgi:hypothetical protein
MEPKRCGCGHTAILDRRARPEDDCQVWFVRCSNKWCGMETPEQERPEEAISTWNRGTSGARIRENTGT